MKLMMKINTKFKIVKKYGAEQKKIFRSKQITNRKKEEKRDDKHSVIFPVGCFSIRTVSEIK